MLENGRGIWKLRAMPRRVRWYAGKPEISSPSNTIEPPSFRSDPEMQLISVVLPEPFGPIRPKRSPRAISTLTSDSAVKPPKCLETPLTRRSASLISCASAS